MYSHWRSRSTSLRNSLVARNVIVSRLRSTVMSRNMVQEVEYNSASRGAQRTFLSPINGGICVIVSRSGQNSGP
jgi:hypothetical protein